MNCFTPVNYERIEWLIGKIIHSDPPILLIDGGMIGEPSIMRFEP